MSANRCLTRVGISLVLGGGLIFGGAGLAFADDGGGTNWDAIAQCESGGNWSTNTGNGFSGGLQFTPSTWAAYGGSGSPQNASREEQISVAEKVKAGQGIGAWPVCGKNAGSSSTGKSSSSNSASSSTKKKSTTSNQQQSKNTTTKRKQNIDTTPEKSAYRIVSGDTLSQIASDHGTSVSALASKNGIANPDKIVAGKVIAL